MLRRMTTFTITPRGRMYIIEATDENGSRKSVGQYATEKMALDRLRSLREIAADIERKDIKPSLGLRR
jgi:hypothetical protein